MPEKMDCKNCKKLLYFNSHYKCYECNCGQVYDEKGKEMKQKPESKADFYY